MSNPNDERIFAAIAASGSKGLSDREIHEAVGFVEADDAGLVRLWNAGRIRPGTNRCGGVRRWWVA